MKVIYKVASVALVSTIVAGGLFAIFRFDLLGMSEKKAPIPHYISNPTFGSNFVGSPKKSYFDQLSSASQTVRSHIPFSDSNYSLSQYDDNFVINKDDFVFNKDVKADEEDSNITWSCEVTYTKTSPLLSSNQPETTKQETCRFFVFPTYKDNEKCGAYAEDLKFLPFFHLTNKTQMPQKILVSVLSKGFSISNKEFKKIVLKKNNKEYLSINKEGLKKNNCFLFDQEQLNYFLVKAIVKDNSNENLFVGNKKNYFCTNDKNIYQSTSGWESVWFYEKNSKCDVFELENSNDENTSNLPLYISSLKSEKKVKDKLQNEKLYILKTTTNSRLNEKTIYLNNQNGNKRNGELKIIANIAITYNDDQPDLFFPKVDYSQKRFIVKASNNLITSTNTDKFQCFYQEDKRFTHSRSWRDAPGCKIYKFEKDVFDIKNISFKKAAKLVTNPKEEIKEGAFYILDVEEKQQERWYFLNKWLKKDLYTFVFGSKGDANKVDLYLDTRFFGDFTKDSSANNNFFLFTDEDKNTKNTKNKNVLTIESASLQKTI